MTDKKIKVLIVEDTLVAQKLLKGIVQSDSRFELVAIAENGIQANEYVAKYKPDVVSMDIIMPFMDGVVATRKIMQDNPVPVVIVSSFYQSSEVDMAIKVLEAGAVTILPRPFGPGHSKFTQSANHYLNTLKLMSEVKVVRRRKDNIQKPIEKAYKSTSVISNQIENNEFKILVIGASAGGPQGLSSILSGIPSDFPLPVLIVQHIDSHFAEGFVTWLNSSSNLPVILTKCDENLKPGHVYLPVGDHHLIVKSGTVVSVVKENTANTLRPSVDVLFKSVAEIFGKNTIAVLLSGMGKDGAAELKNLYEKGAYTIAQDEASSLVFGMPGEAVKLGGVCKLLSPENIVKEIINLIKI